MKYKKFQNFDTMQQEDNDIIQINNIQNNNENIKEKKLTKIQLLYIILIYLLIFQNVLQNYIVILRYLDESFTIIGIGVGLISLAKNNFKLKKEDFLIILCLSIITFIGFYSIFKYQYQTLKYALIDWVLIIKFFATYCFSQVIFKNIYKDNNSSNIEIHIKIMTVILFVLTILNYIFDLYEEATRYGIKANKLFFGHQTNLAASCMTILANNIVFSKKINSVYNYMIMLVLVSTIRLKAIGAAIASIVIIIYVVKNNKKITFSKLGIIAIICIAIAYNQISSYFINTDGSARKVLTTTSIQIAKDYFPIGTGFGTYGSFSSSVNYSPVYLVYGLNKIQGLGTTGGFIIDTFWPMIIGQFGYVGTVCYIICLLLIFKKIQKGYSGENKKIYIAQLICFSYLLISSTSEAAFTNSLAIPLTLILGTH